MLIDEARIRYQLLVAESHRAQHLAEAAEVRRLDRLQRRVAVLSARLGLAAAATAS